MQVGDLVTFRWPIGPRKATMGIVLKKYAPSHAIAVLGDVYDVLVGSIIHKFRTRDLEVLSASR